MKLLIGVLSCQIYYERREACRSSWVTSASNYPDVTTLFVMGSKDVKVPTRGGDTLYVPCTDEYEGLVRKVFWLNRWAFTNGFDYLFKCDDDTFVHVPRLMARLQNPIPDYLGYLFRLRRKNETGTYASGGAGYLLSAKAIELIANNPELIVHSGCEDVIIGKYLAEHNILVKHEPRFCPLGDRYPTVDNDVITTHYVKADEMMPLHRKSITINPTGPFTEEQEALMASRLAVCKTCPKNRDPDGKSTGKWGVACDCRECKAKPLLTWICPEKKW